MSTIHRKDAEILLEKVKTVIESKILHQDLARDLIEVNLAIAYNHGKADQLVEDNKVLEND